MKHIILFYNPRTEYVATTEFDSFDAARSFMRGAEAFRYHFCGKDSVQVEHFYAESADQLRLTHGHYFWGEVKA